MAQAAHTQVDGDLVCVASRAWPCRDTHLEHDARSFALEEVCLVHGEAFNKIPLFCRIICAGSARAESACSCCAWLMCACTSAAAHGRTDSPALRITRLDWTRRQQGSPANCLEGGDARRIPVVDIARHAPGVSARPPPGFGSSCIVAALRVLSCFVDLSGQSPLSLGLHHLYKTLVTRSDIPLPRPAWNVCVSPSSRARPRVKLVSLRGRADTAALRVFKSHQSWQHAIRGTVRAQEVTLG